jgi:hypothetical protein
LRNVFGLDFKRIVGPGGIRFLNIQYRSAELHKHFLKAGGVSLTCRVHLANLGAVSVKIGKRWLTVRGPKEFDGVDAETWIAAEAAIRAKMKTTEKTITGPIINAAILDISRMAEEARKRARIDDSPLPRKAVLAAEARMRVFANFPEDREDEPASNQDIYATSLKVGGSAVDADAAVDTDDRPTPAARRTTRRPHRGGKRALTTSKSRTSARARAKAAAKPVRKAASKPTAAPAPVTRQPSRPRRRPGLKRAFTAKD